MPETNLKFHSAHGKRQLLVVEDEVINREILGMILEELYEPIYAETGAEALAKAHAYADTLSLVLLDLNLPDMHGLDVLRQFKGNDQLSRLPVIVMTAEKDAEVESLNIGAIDFIPKPYPQPKVILARINRTIELSEDRDIIRWTERDQLTGLYNREYFYRYAAQFDTYHKDLETDAIVVDINHFHILNERCGKAYGDEVLMKVGNKLRDLVKDGEGIVCRREADTFLIYCPHRTDYAEILEKASINLDGGNRIRLRMGVYSNVDKNIDIERRFDRAKSAADTVRSNFTKTIGIYDNSLHEAEMFTEQLLDDFRTAIEEKQFTVFYQPKFDVRPQEPILSSAEALVRWKHPTLGMISPGIFIPLFENNGLIQELDSYVWREAACRISTWKKTLGMTIPVSVNVSRIDMYDPDFVSHVEGLVKEFDLDPAELLLEITESAYTENSGQIISKVSELQEKGFRIEMDDFGSGYSSLNMISTLPVDALKLDMQFIRNAFRERKDTRLLEIVISLAESLHVPTIAEGVETAEQMLTLKSMGCDFVQGYYFSKPLPANEFEEYVRAHKGSVQPVQELEKSYSRERKDRFAYDALHDPMTGLYNNSAFDILFHHTDKDHIAVLIADVDGYEKICAEKGKVYADSVIKRAAAVLRESFRNVDDICRLKEDEFVIIMTRMTETMEKLVYDKVSQINAALQNPPEGEPAQSLCFGVAFSDRLNPGEDIFDDADSALIRAKQEGSVCCIF